MIQWQEIKDRFSEDARIPLAINIVCVILLILIIAQAFSNISVVQQMPQMTLQANKKLNHISLLRAFHFFGIYDKSLSQLPETRLLLSLVGTMVFSSKKQFSYALISASAGTTKIYHIGGSIPGGVTLKEVHNNYIILDVSGSLQMLRIPIPKLKS